MSQNATAVAAPPATPPAGRAEGRTIVTRFGELAVDEDKIITFVDGLYGFEQHRHYIMTQVPGWAEVFKLLQAIDDPQLSLIVLPMEGGAGPIDGADFTHACGTLGFDREATAILGIVTMRTDGQNQGFTVNLKAPLLIDTERLIGRQYVFADDKYHLRHPLPVDQNREG